MSILRCKIFGCAIFIVEAPDVTSKGDEEHEDIEMACQGSEMNSRVPLEVTLVWITTVKTKWKYSRDLGKETSLIFMVVGYGNIYRSY